MSQPVTQPQAITLQVPITKIDKATRRVRGVATAEVVDSHGDVVDYETAKAVFQEWRGNIREMHERKAVGKRVSMEFDDDAKQIIVESYISKGAEDTWQKVLDGTLSMYSIGAMGLRKAEKALTGQEARVFLKTMGELSLVDNGACPTAAFEIVKLTDDHLLATQSDDEEPAPALTLTGLPTPIVRAVGDRTLTARALLAQIETGTALADAADVVIQKRVESYDIRNALQAIGYLEELVASEIWEGQDDARNGKAPDPEAAAQLGLLKTSAELLLAFLISEFLAQFETPASADTPATLTNVRASAAAAPALAGAVNLGDLALNVLKVGKRHSSSDETLIQAMHDSSVTLGALCATLEKVADPVPPAAAPDLTALLARIDKLEATTATQTADLASARQTIQDQQESLTKATAQIQALENAPAPGGPQRSAVGIEKTLGGPAPSPTGAATPATVAAVLTQVAQTQTDERVREALAKEILKLQFPA